MTRKDPIRQTIRDLRPSGITQVTALGLGHPDVLPLREAIRDFHKRTAGADIPIERITVPGGAMLAVVTALQMVCETGDNVVIVSPIWPNIFQATKVVGAEPRLVRLDEDWDRGRWR